MKNTSDPDPDPDPDPGGCDPGSHTPRYDPAAATLSIDQSVDQSNRSPGILNFQLTKTIS